MEDEDLDLSAWAAPPAPSGLADRVIARVTATDAVAVAAHQRARTRRAFWLAGGLVATLAAAAVVAVIVLTRSPEPAATPASGALVATRPQQLSLPGAVANLDPGASVGWQLAGDAIHVQQHGGAATWRVDKPKLFLDVGAAVASIEATNATLRVETRMNLTDARVIGAAAVTSATVALVTVSVYEGHARLSSAGQTVVIQPGATYQVAAGKPPTIEMTFRPDHPDPPVAARNVGGGPMSDDGPELVLPLGEKVTIHDPRGAIRLAMDRQCEGDASPLYPNGANALTEAGDYHVSATCNGLDKHGEVIVVRDAGLGVIFSPFDSATWGRTVHVGGRPVPARAQVTIDGVPVATQNNTAWSADVTPATPGFVAVRIDGGLDEVDYYIRRGTVAPSVRPEAHTVQDFDRVMKVLDPALAQCVKGFPDGQDVAVEVAPNGRVSDILTTNSDPGVDACLRKVLRNAAFPRARAASRSTYHVAPACNVEELQAAGTAAVARGAHAEAVKNYDAALRCKYDVHSLQLAFMAACRAGEVDYAKKYWKRMSADMKSHLLQMCLHEHITEDQLNE